MKQPTLNKAYGGSWRAGSAIYQPGNDTFVAPASCRHILARAKIVAPGERLRSPAVSRQDAGATKDTLPGQFWRDLSQLFNVGCITSMEETLPTFA
jgi:hypothetical protein